VPNHAFRSYAPPATFNPAIDALRALAITLVIAYHTVPAAVPAGLVGVDVFFVVSGFLILGTITAQLDSGTFSLIGFLKRRALRILPPLAVIIVVSAIAASFVLVTPQEVADFRRDLSWALTFTSNFAYATQLGYFDSVASRHVLLHLWSLAVEEQFYVVAPLALLAFFWLTGRISRSARVRLAIVLAAMVGVASFVGGVVAGRGLAPAEGFYLPQYRVWEFLGGAAAGTLLPLMSRVPPWLKDAIVIAGVAAILATAFGADPDSTYPGLFTLLPVGGAVAVIVGGSQRSSLVWRVLTVAPVLWLGLVSYELYLWHWPVLSLVRFASFGTLTPMALVLCVIGSIGLAAITHWLLFPFVSRLRALAGRRRELAATVAAVAVFLGLGYGANSGLGLVEAQARRSIPPLLIPDMQRAVGCNVLNSRSIVAACLPATPTGQLGLIVGDSHAGANFTVLADLAHARGNGLVVASFSGCSPFLTIDRTSDGSPATCSAWHNQVLDDLAKRTSALSYAIVTAQWLFHQNVLRATDQGTAFQAGLTDMFAALRKGGVKRILVTGTPPLLRKEPGDCVVRAMALDRDVASTCGVPRKRHDDQTARITSWMNAAIGADPDIRLIDPAVPFCGPDWCNPIKDGAALLADHDHLSAAGVTLLTTFYALDFEWVMAAH